MLVRWRLTWVVSRGYRAEQTGQSCTVQSGAAVAMWAPSAEKAMQVAAALWPSRTAFSVSLAPKAQVRAVPSEKAAAIVLPVVENVMALTAPFLVLSAVFGVILAPTSQIWIVPSALPEIS